MAVVDTDARLSRDGLESLGDDDLKTYAKAKGLSTRGRFNRGKLIDRTLEALKNLNGHSHPTMESAAEGADSSASVDPAEEVESDTDDPTTDQKTKDIQIERITGHDLEKLNAKLFTLVAKHHPHLEAADFTLLWRHGWKAEADTGRVKRMEVKKASETMRTSKDFGDFLLYVNYDLFGKGNPKASQISAAIDEQISKCKPDLDKDGQQKRNSAGHRLWRIRRGIEMIPEVAERHGALTDEQVEISEALSSHKRQASLFDKG